MQASVTPSRVVRLLKGKEHSHNLCHSGKQIGTAVHLFARPPQCPLAAVMVQDAGMALAYGC